MIKLDPDLVLAKIQDEIRTHLPQSERGLRDYHAHLANGIARAINASGGLCAERVDSIGRDYVFQLLLQRV